MNGYKPAILFCFLFLVNWFDRAKVCLKHRIPMQPYVSRYLLPGQILFLCPECFSMSSLLKETMEPKFEALP